jgi:uncharacterized membrane protein YphA (DoxX/SURF4 family)
MLENIFAPFSDWGLLILRVALGIVMIAHGWPKLNPNGPMGGPGGLAGFLKQMGVPLPHSSPGSSLCWRRSARVCSSWVWERAFWPWGS